MRFKKSTLNAHTFGIQDFPKYTPIFFQNSKVTGCSIGFESGGTTIELKNPGLYYFNISATGTITTGSGEISLTMFENGDKVNNATAGETAASTSTNVTLSFSQIVEVTNQPKKITFVTGENPPTFLNTNLTAFKLA